VGFEPGSSVPEADAMSTSLGNNILRMYVNMCSCCGIFAFWSTELSNFMPPELNALPPVQKLAFLLKPGLPDGLISNKKSKFGYILEDLAMEDNGISYGHMVHFTGFYYILWTFGIA
jgi:hypothetical protein